MRTIRRKTKDDVHAQAKARRELEQRWFEDGGAQTESGDEPRETMQKPLEHDEDPRYRGTDPHDTFPGERRAPPTRTLRRQRSADGGGAKRGSPASRDSRRQ